MHIDRYFLLATASLNTNFYFFFSEVVRYAFHSFFRLKLGLKWLFGRLRLFTHLLVLRRALIGNVLMYLLMQLLNQPNMKLNILNFTNIDLSLGDQFPHGRTRYIFQLLSNVLLYRSLPDWYRPIQLILFCILGLLWLWPVYVKLGLFDGVVWWWFLVLWLGAHDWVVICATEVGNMSRRPLIA